MGDAISTMGNQDDFEIPLDQLDEGQALARNNDIFV